MHSRYAGRLKPPARITKPGTQRVPGGLEEAAQAAFVTCSRALERDGDRIQPECISPMIWAASLDNAVPFSYTVRAAPRPATIGRAISSVGVAHTGRIALDAARVRRSMGALCAMETSRVAA